MIDLKSLPSWECGLKQEEKKMGGWIFIVAPLVGVWIETNKKDSRI